MTMKPNRRNFLSFTAAAAGAGLLQAAWGGAKTQAAEKTTSAKEPDVRPFENYAQLLKTLEKRGHKPRVLGYAPDRAPIVGIKAGGEKLPAIFISAGSHATEHAGVVAAVELIDRLETEHQVFVAPTRDPIALNGYRYALSLSLGEEPRIENLEQMEKLLREKGKVLYDVDETLLVLIGEIGYANRGLYRKLDKGAPFLEPLKGRRIYFPARSEEVEGTAPLERAYTLIVTPEAEVLHINRFHDTAWAPVEVRCVRELMAEVRPRLVFDLHEHGGKGFWYSARKQKTEEDEIWENRMGREAIAAVAASGVELAADEYSPGGFFTKLQRAAFTLDASQRGEGLNLIDFAADQYGPGFTVETGMLNPFVERVRTSMLMVQTAVKVFEARYA